MSTRFLNPSTCSLVIIGSSFDLLKVAKIPGTYTYEKVATKLIHTQALIVPSTISSGSSTLSEASLKPYLRGRLRLGWAFSLGLILLFSALLFIAVLYGIRTGNNQYLSLVFLAMIVLPFAVLSRAGRRAIGIRRPRRAVALMFLTGLVFHYAKAVSGSIWGAVLGHMAFNVVMTSLIFYVVFA
jgi:hypothetical protein